jgi:dihydrofolate synthase/folylpolyglutamate synthase
MTAMALLLFRARRIDTAVLEVGMGGRLDATNIVTPALSVITPIDFDHEQFLGGTIPKIAFEKAGIIKPGRPVVFSRQRPDALPVLREKAAREHAPIIDSASWRAEDLDIHPYGSIFRAVGPHAFEIECPLIGEHQVDNALTAIAALDHLGLGPAEIHDGIAHTRWPGRLERVRRHPDIFLDGAHNPAGAAALARYLETFQRGRTIWMIFAAMRDKDVHLIGERIFPLASHLIFTTANQTRAFSAHELRELSGFPAARTTGSIREALDLTSAASPEDLIIVTGSLYLVGEARAILVS